MANDNAEQWAHRKICEALNLEISEKIPAEYLSQYQAIVDFNRQFRTIETKFGDIYSQVINLEREIIQQRAISSASHTLNP